MKYKMLLMALITIVISSCSSTKTGVGGTNSTLAVKTRGVSMNDYELVPAGDRITYTIDISTPEGKLKLNKLSEKEAAELAQVEAAYKYNCDRLIDPHFTYLRKGKRILRVTVMGRPGVYKARENQYDSRTRQEIDINVRH
jgi:hypothetical protein